MAGDANTPRKASIKLLRQQLQALKLTAGILIKSTRSYKRAGRKDGFLQSDIATLIGRTQGEISRIENGTLLLPDTQLKKLLKKVGFKTNQMGGKAFYKLLQFIRDESANISKIENEKP